MNLYKLETVNIINGNSEETLVNLDSICTVVTVPTYHNGKKINASSIMLNSGQNIMVTEKEAAKIYEALKYGEKKVTKK